MHLSNANGWKIMLNWRDGKYSNIPYRSLLVYAANSHLKETSLNMQEIVVKGSY